MRRHAVSLNVEGEPCLEDKHNRQAIGHCLEAIVERAIRDGLGLTQIERHYQTDARQWLHSDSEENWSFLWVAAHLRLSSKFINNVRRQIPR